MKISILTFAKGDNYGAVWQAYGLADVLRRRGYEVEFIHFTWSNWIHKIISNITPLNIRFERFRNKYLKPFSKKCKSIEDLKDAVKDSDICIVGSDQVWNPDITTFRAKHYFFDFVPDNIPTISYAASFGVDKWKWHDLKKDVSYLLSRFKKVSVREDSAVEICKEEFGVEAVKVLDPTLLLGDFSSLLLKRRSENYVLGFKFVTSPEYYDFVKKVGIFLNSEVKIMDMFPRDFKFIHGFKKKYFPSPQEWITNIAYAKFVITDSFHTMAFAIIFKREFIIIPSSRLAALQGRMISLLKDLGLENRIFPSMEEASISRIWESTIDYKEVDLKLNTLRESSIGFLKSALGTIE